MIESVDHDKCNVVALGMLNNHNQLNHFIARLPLTQKYFWTDEVNVIVDPDDEN